MTMDDFRSLVNMRPTPPTGRSVLPGESALDIVSGDTLWLPGNELVVDFGIAESADALSKVDDARRPSFLGYKPIHLSHWQYT